MSVKEEESNKWPGRRGGLRIYERYAVSAETIGSIHHSSLGAPLENCAPRPHGQ